MTDAIEAIYRAVGQAIREHRKRAAMTQDELAEAAGLSRTSIVNIEQGTQRMMLHTIEAIARALEVGMLKLIPQEKAADALVKNMADRKALRRELRAAQAKAGVLRRAVSQL
jgi:transcriptional regulator with XRE-family HTH domain